TQGFHGLSSTRSTTQTLIRSRTLLPKLNLMRSFFNPKSSLAILLIIVMVLGGSLVPAVIFSRSTGTPSHIPQPPTGTTDQLGIDCGQGSTQAVINGTGFPVSPTENAGFGGAGQTLPQCTWIGDLAQTGLAMPVGTSDGTTEPLVSDQDEIVGATSPLIGGGFTADMVFLQTAGSTINGFDITVSWDPSILRMVKFDQTGLFWSTLGTFTPTSPTIDNVVGQ